MNGKKASAYARPNRLSIALSWGGGWASLSRFHQGVDQYIERIQRGNPAVQFDESPKSHFFINSELSLRYYFAQHVFAQIGYALLHNQASTGLTVGSSEGTLGYRNVAMEMVLLVGGYFTLLDSLYVYCGLGPSLLTFSTSYWNFSLGRIADLKGPRGGGIHAVSGVDVLLMEHLAIGAEFRYRYVNTSELEASEIAFPPMQPLEELNFSGPLLMINLRVFLH